MRVDTGAVVALACSGNYFDGVNGQVNTALAPRPAGSTLKPFLVAHALDRGLATPEERIVDAPVALTFAVGNRLEQTHLGSTLYFATTLNALTEHSAPHTVVYLRMPS